MGRGSRVYCLITFSFWAEDLVKFDPVWKETLRSLTLGLEVEDPTGRADQELRLKNSGLSVRGLCVFVRLPS